MIVVWGGGTGIDPVMQVAFRPGDAHHFGVVSWLPVPPPPLQSPRWAAGESAPPGVTGATASRAP